MKNLLLLFFICITNLFFSQTTLTQALNEPVAGEVEKTFGLDTSAYTAGLPINVIGNNVTWDFTNVVGFEPLLKNKYLNAASVSGSTNYPGCNLVQESGGFYTYLKSTASPTTQTELLGLNISSATLTFTNSAIIAQYPISFGSSSTDNVSGSFTYSVNGNFSGSITNSADGIGTLNLPMNTTLNNVLRVKSVQSINFYASLLPVGSFKQTTYSYYSPLFKFPIITISYSKLASVLTSSTIVSAFATASADYLTVGLKETILSEQNLNLFPNPVRNNLNVELTAPLSLNSANLYNQLGELVLHSTSHSINVSELSSGIYITEIITDKGVIRKKIVKE